MRVFRPSQRIAGADSEIRRRLFCFPYAGGGAALFRTWADLLPPDIEVCVPVLPGRDARVDEAPMVEMAPLIQTVMQQVEPRLTLPYAMFGHSLGAFIAFDLAHEISRRGLRKPSHLFMAAQRGPSLPYPDTPIFHLPDPQFLAGVLARYQSISKTLLQETEFMRIFLRILRADFTLVEDYRYRTPPRLDCPITAFGGADDTRITAAQIETWSKETSGSFSLHVLPGGHFFMDSARAELLALIRQGMDA
jgi:medium-chain acyl-[acyl-carrier-protein] hydrolase